MCWPENKFTLSQDEQKVLRRLARDGLATRVGLTPPIAAPAFPFSRFQSSSFCSLSRFSSSASQNGDTDLAQNLFSIAHNPVSVEDAQIWHSLSGTFLMG
jgi:hypothetical protein